MTRGPRRSQLYDTGPRRAIEAGGPGELARASRKLLRENRGVKLVRR